MINIGGSGVEEAFFGHEGEDAGGVGGGGGGVDAVGRHEEVGGVGYVKCLAFEGVPKHGCRGVEGDYLAETVGVVTFGQYDVLAHYGAQGEAFLYLHIFVSF